MKLVNKHFSGSITVGNELKPDYVLNSKATLAYMEENGDDENPQVSLASAKPVLDYAVKYNIEQCSYPISHFVRNQCQYYANGVDIKEQLWC